jgi:hypothetical protein
MILIKIILLQEQSNNNEQWKNIDKYYKFAYQLVSFNMYDYDKDFHINNPIDALKTWNQLLSKIQSQQGGQRGNILKLYNKYVLLI